jgi:integrase
VRVYVNDLKAYKSFTADSKRGAERMANDWLIEHEEEVRREQMLTFEKAANAYIEQRRTTLSPTTIAGYETIMKNNVERLKNIALDELTQQQIQDWVNELTVSLSPKSVRNIYGFFKSVVNYHDVPLRLSKIQLPRKTRKFKRLPSAQLVIDTFKGTDIELPVLLAVWGSLRMSEILGIQARDIEGDVLTISRVKVKVNNETVVKERAKTYNSNRQLRLPPPIMELVRSTGKSGKEFLIDYTRSQIFEKYTWQMKKLGYQVTFHDLRHINASVMAALNIPDLYAMERGGWSNTNTLKAVYQQTFSTERMKYDAVIDDYFNNLYDTKYDTKIKKAL